MIGSGSETGLNWLHEELGSTGRYSNLDSARLICQSQRDEAQWVQFAQIFWGIFLECGLHPCTQEGGKLIPPPIPSTYRDIPTLRSSTRPTLRHWSEISTIKIADAIAETIAFFWTGDNVTDSGEHKSTSSDSIVARWCHVRA